MHARLGRRCWATSADGCWSPTCPYNVATPLVCDLLDGVPADRAHAGDGAARGGRTVLCRAAHPAVRGGHREDLVLGHGPHRRATCRPACSCPGRTWSPRWPTSAACPQPAVDAPPADLFHLVRTGFGQRRKMLRRSLADVVAPEVFEAAGIDSQRRPEELDVYEWGRSPSPGERPDEHRRRSRCRAPAKLTLSLRITGVRADGYHLIDAEMVSLEWADTLTITPGGSGLTADGPFAAGMPLDDTNLVAKALRLAERDGSGAPAQVDPARRRARRRHVATRPPCCAGPATPTSPPPRGWAPTSASAWSAAGHGCSGIGEIVEPLPFQPLDITLVVPPLAVSTPAAYRAWDELGMPTADGPNDLEPAALAGGAAAGRAGATESAKRPALRPRWPAAVRRGSSWVTTPSLRRCRRRWWC